LPLDVVAVRKIGHPWQPEYALGAVAPGGDGVYLRSHDGLDEAALGRMVELAKAKADVLDRRVHARRAPLDLRGKTVVLVDDGLATGATMVAAVRWARGGGAARVVVAVPVGAAHSVRFLGAEADEVVCPHAEEDFRAVGFWYDVFSQVDDGEVVALLDEARASPEALATRTLQRSEQRQADSSSADPYDAGKPL